MTFYLGDAWCAGARAENAEGCVNADGDPVLCCSWQVDSFGRSYAAFATIVTLWTTLLVKEIRVFVTSGVVAQVRVSLPLSK